MKIVIAGGTGHLGQYLVDRWLKQNHDVVVLSRGGESRARLVKWDGRSQGAWSSEIDGADVVVNLAGRSVNCRYTAKNLKQMMDSRVDSTQAIGQAIRAAQKPPALWLQMSTATIYAHSFDFDNDESTGIIGGAEKEVPAYWKLSVDIAEAWEKAQSEAQVPSTRRVALRTSMVLGRHPESVLGVLAQMTRIGLGGSIGGGRQYVSWIHEEDFARALEFLIENTRLSGVVNVCSPHPLPQKDLMQTLRRVLGVYIGLPAFAWMAKIGAVFMRTDAELILKSRRVVPSRLLQEGFFFKFPRWSEAAQNLFAKDSL